MGMERVTVEQNGERFVIEVPEGTSDADITKFLNQQQSTAGGMTQPPPNPAENAAAYGLQSAGTAYGKYAGATGGGLIGDVYKVGKALGQATPEVIGEVAARPIHYGQELIKAYAAGLPMAKQPISQIAGNAIRGAGTSLFAPENVMTLPYNMAAYEQEKIRQNPNAPGLEFNPYAQVQRGEAKTQGRAGEANRMRAIAEMPYGNVTPEEKRILDEDAKMRQNIRKKAYEKVMGPIAPTQGALGATSGY